MTIFIANWKMNYQKNAIHYLDTLHNFAKNNLQHSIFVSPSFIQLNEINSITQSLNTKYGILNNINIASQDISQYKTGAYTAQVSAEMIHSIGLNWTIIGHSETRFKSVDINSKIKNAIDNKLNIIYCIGENLNDKEEKDIAKVLIHNIMNDFQIEDIELIKRYDIQLIIAYEPVWSIGTNKIPTNEELSNSIDIIKTCFNEIFDIHPKIIYGGSVDKNNVNKILNNNMIEGVLVGRQSVEIENFVNIMNCVV